MNKKQYQSGNAHLIIIIILALALIGSLGALFWLNFMQPKNNNILNTDNNEITVVATNELNISNMGIKIINIPASISDLYYDYSSNSEILSGDEYAAFGTRQLDIASASTCIPSNHSQGIGKLRKIEGIYDGSGLPSAAFVKQFTGFFITYSHPQAPCDLTDVVSIDKTSVQALFNYQISVFQTLAISPDNIVAH